MMDFKNKKVAILGFGIEGRDLVKFLLQKGAIVTVLDRKVQSELDLAGLPAPKINFICGPDYLSQGLKDYEIVFRSPGVYRYLPEIIEAEKSGVEISSSIKLFFDLCPAKIIGVTGTKGKGTTSTLIYKILETSGKNVYLAGNIGKPVLSLLPKLKKDSWVILELSSFQLIDMAKSPHIAVVLNITLDHMDWHKNKEEYVNAKKNIVRFQLEDDLAVINADYESSMQFAKEAKAGKYYFSKKKKVKGCYVQKNQIVLETSGEKWEVGSTKDLLLRGRHNWENVSAAVCASYLAKADIDSIKKAVFSFKGLEHRLELVESVGGVTFYNDSISTNPQTTRAAVEAFSESKTLILGGSDKGLGYDEMARKISSDKSVKGIIFIGEIGKKIADSFKKANFSGGALILGKVPMDRVIEVAAQSTPKGGIVLLSPATASFDMFKDYKDRGNQFKEAVVNYAKIVG